MKIKRAIVYVMVSVVLAAMALGVEVKTGKVPETLVPVKFTFTESEVIEALKEYARQAYPNADMTSTNVELEWGHNHWSSMQDKGSKSIALTLQMQPKITVPKKSDVIMRQWQAATNLWIFGGATAITNNAAVVN